MSAVAFGTSVVVGCRYSYIRCKQQPDASGGKCMTIDDCNLDESTISLTRHSSSSTSTLSSFHLVRHLSTNSKWSEYNDDHESFIQDFPKVELHVVRCYADLYTSLDEIVKHALIRSYCTPPLYVNIQIYRINLALRRQL